MGFWGADFGGIPGGTFRRFFGGANFVPKGSKVVDAHAVTAVGLARCSSGNSFESPRTHGAMFLASL